MSIITLLLLAVALGTDAFSMCLAIGLTGIRRRQILLISFTVLIFHIVMPLAGWYIGELAGTLIGNAAAIIGASILIFLGVKMLRDVIKKDAESSSRVLLLNTWGLLLLAASVSMDALSVGFTLGTQKVNLLLAAGVFGLVAGLMTFGGLCLGRLLGRVTGERAQLAGGIILIGIGIKLLI
jgi:putative Mn2+ efflux pump MntP